MSDSNDQLENTEPVDQDYTNAQFSPAESVLTSIRNELDELSFTSLNESQAIELSLDLAAENNRLLRETRSKDTEQKSWIAGLLKHQTELEGRITEAEALQKMNDSKIREERDSKAMIIDDLKTENGRLRRELDSSENEVVRLRDLLKITNNRSPVKNAQDCALRDPTPDIIDDIPGKDVQILHSQLMQETKEKQQLMKEFDEMVERNSAEKDRLSGAILHVEEQLIISQKTHEELEENYHKCLEQSRHLFTQVQELQVELQECENLYCLTQKELQNCQLQKAALEERLQEVKVNIDHTQQVINKNKALTIQVDNLTKGKSDAETKLHESSVAMKKLEKDLNEARKTASFLSKDSSTPALYQENLKSLREDLQLSKKNESDVKLLNEQLNARIAAVKDVQVTYTKLKEDLRKREEDIEELRRKESNFEKVMDEHLQEKKELNCQMQRLQEQCNMLQTDLKSINGEYQDFRVNAQMQYDETCRKHANQCTAHETKERRLLAQLNKYEQYPGKATVEMVSNVAQTETVDICNHLQKLNAILESFSNENVHESTFEMFNFILNSIWQFLAQEEQSLEEMAPNMIGGVQKYIEDVIKSCNSCKSLRENVKCLQDRMDSKLKEQIRRQEEGEEKLNGEMEEYEQRVLIEQRQQQENYNKQLNKINQQMHVKQEQIDRLHDEIREMKMKLNQEMEILRNDVQCKSDEIERKEAQLQNLSEQFVNHVQVTEQLHAQSTETVARLSQVLTDEQELSEELRIQNDRLIHEVEILRRELVDERNANQIHMATFQPVTPKYTTVDALKNTIKLLKRRKKMLINQKKYLCHELGIVRAREMCALKMLGLPLPKPSPLSRFRSHVIAVTMAIRLSKAIIHR